MNSMMPILRRRSIEEDDFDALAAFLALGFSGRAPAHWRRGLERLRSRESPAGFPRYGRLLETGGRVVGCLLMIHAEIDGGTGGSHIRCNLSSWSVDPDFAGHAPLLLGAALRDKSVTYVNISPALHTQPIIEAQGFRPFASGSLATVPLAVRPREEARVRPVADEDRRNMVDGGLVSDHAALGCLCLIVEAADGQHPFVFSVPRRLGRVVPATQLLYCRDVSAFVRFAGALGPALLRRGAALALVDGVKRLPGVPGRPINMRQKRYVVGSHPPRPGDLAYTELAVFG